MKLAPKGARGNATTKTSSSSPRAPKRTSAKKAVGPATSQASTAATATTAAIATHSPALSVGSFGLRMRGLSERDANARLFSGASAEAFDAALSVDVSKVTEPILVWDDRERAIALDFDRPANAPPLTDADVERLMPANAPKPYAAWVTHGGGLRVIFVEVAGVSALALACVWLILAPLGVLASWKLEIKTDTRHPKGLRDGSTCGQIFRFAPDAAFSFRADDGIASDAQVQAWLTARNMQIGGRYDTSFCPWNCGPSSGNPAVSVHVQGIRCFRCKGHGAWWELLGTGGGVQLETHNALRAFVHLPHEELVLLARYPLLTSELIEAAYPVLLRGVHADRLAGPNARKLEKRIRDASSRRLDIVRGSSTPWLDAETLDARRVTGGKTLKYLPSVFWPPQVEKAENAGPLPGFVSIHPIGAVEVLAPGARPPRDSLFVRRPPAQDDPPPVALSMRPTPQGVEDAWTVLDAALPGINRGYHVGCLVAMLTAQAAVGTPPMLVVTGLTGSAKTAQLHLAAGAIGSKAVLINLAQTDDSTRKIGLALEEGAGAILIDELGRVEGLFAKIEPLLSANSQLVFKPLYANERRVLMRAGVILMGSTIPPSVVRSPELARRAVGYRLSGANKVWLVADANGRRLDLADARRHPLIREALDTITASVWWTLDDLGPGGDWRRLLLDHFDADELPHLDVEDHDGTHRRSALRALYERFRTARSNELYSGSKWKDWLIADRGTAAGNELAALVDLDAGDSRRFHAEKSDIERLDLRPILGISAPHLGILINRRNPHVLVKFFETGKLKGRGVAREQLPALGPDGPVPSTASTVKV